MLRLNLQAFCSALVLGLLVCGAITAKDFGVMEYDAFHDVLHPLEHEALPKNDFATIRARAGELVTLGQAIIKLGVPAGTKAEDQEDFKQELNKFKEALKRFRKAAKSGTDAQLKTTYSAVHDSFEMLAAMLPRS